MVSRLALSCGLVAALTVAATPLFGLPYQPDKPPEPGHVVPNPQPENLPPLTDAQRLVFEKDLAQLGTANLINYVKEASGQISGNALEATIPGDRYPNAETSAFKALIVKFTSPGLGSTRWQHYLVIYVPDDLTNANAFLEVKGNAPDLKQPTKDGASYGKLAVNTRSVVAQVWNVPNQPIKGEDGVSRYEDDLIAYQEKQFIDNPHRLTGQNRANLLVRLPMVASVVAAMTEVQDRVASYRKFKIDHFVLEGASKRGWVVWLAAAVKSEIDKAAGHDRTVVGLIPISINTLKVNASIEHQWESLGFFSNALEPYRGLIPDEVGSKELNAVNAIEDPWSYMLGSDHEPTYTSELNLIPKYIINAAGDQYFMPDNTRFSFPWMRNAWLWVLPNKGHSINPEEIHLRPDPQDLNKYEFDLLKAYPSIGTFYSLLVEGRRPPKFGWCLASSSSTVISIGGRPRVKSPTGSTVAYSQLKLFVPHGGPEVLSAALWQTSHWYNRDFRLYNSDGKLGPQFFRATFREGTVVNDGPNTMYPIVIDDRHNAYTGFFGELRFAVTVRANGKERTEPFFATSEFYVTPDKLSYDWHMAKAITRPDSRTPVRLHSAPHRETCEWVRN